MKKRASNFYILCLLIVSCTQSKQFEHGGGALRMSLDNKPTTTVTRNVMDYYSSTVLMQVSEGLVGIDSRTTKIRPRLAVKWVESDDGKVYTFTLREGVYFHPHPVFSEKSERKMTASDVVKSVELACSKDKSGNAAASYLYIFKDLLKGAKEFHDGKSKTISGLTVDGANVSFELLHRDRNFLYKLANVGASIVSKKVAESASSDAVVGTGPFRYGEYLENDNPQLILFKNNDYYLQDAQGNALPYLDSLVFLFENRKLDQLKLFESEKTDLIIGLPTTHIAKMLEGRIDDFNAKPPKLLLENNPLLESHFYFFNLTDDRFKDPRVRKAFNYAVDKEVIGRKILRNQYHDLGIYGLTPPVPKTMKGYDFESIASVGYRYDPVKARKLLAEAGYPNGEGFGSVTLRYNINDRHSAVADEFAKQISRVLGVNINIDGSTFEQLNIDGENGHGDIFRMSWNADFPSPETFLINFYGDFVPEDPTSPSSINQSRYKNPIFDQFFEQAQASKKITEQMKLFSKAEVTLMEDPPIIPIWYTGDLEITYAHVRNLHFNALNIFDFTKVYKKEWTVEEYEKRLSNDE